MVWIEMTGSEQLFWGGIALMGAAAVLMVVWLAVFVVTGKRQRKRLEQEYGKPER